ncbi:collagenase [Streptomyces sp. NPDC079020]|uniref:M9 family metallopeptidase n=1 Tax=Streptomyces sp. NPDC079020 TaxID=3365722 RepID=UPI0037D1F72F
MKNRTVRQRDTGRSTRSPARISAGISAAVLAACLGVGLLAAPAQSAQPKAALAAGALSEAPAPGTGAAGAPEPGGPTARSSAPTAEDPEHVGTAPLKPADRAPQSADKDALRRDYDDSAAAAPSRRAPSMSDKARLAAKSRGLTTAAACNVSDFAGRTGDALVQQVISSTTDCVNTLFTIKGQDGYNVFREAQMVTIADAMRARTAAYPGDSSTGMPQLVLFLRAGYYVQYYDPSTVGSYGPALRSAIQGALDGFFASSHSSDVTDANGETLSEAVILIDSAVENARYLSVVKRLLAGYDSSYNSSWYMLKAVNAVYTVTFRGHQVPEFISAVEADPSLIDALHDFAANHLDLLGTERSYLASNAGRELGRFLKEPSLRGKASPLAVSLLKKSSITGPTAALWIGVAEMADYYDRANCSTYDTCDLSARLKAAVLPVKHTCSDSINILAQDISTADLEASCTSLRNQDAYFHNIARDNGPVADDRNNKIEVVVFDSSADYQTYAGAIYGIDTNNGGMYLEGDPSVEGNQPRFIAYEAEWVRPEFQIWNLNHEYTHYLDGRFNMHGDFEDGLTTPTIWWVEGFAEYVSYSYRNVTYDAAISQAGKGTYTLRSLFDTTYENADQTRIYNWGYLAVRYMLQSHRGDVDQLLGLYRSGDWESARTLLTSTIGSRYDADWSSWLTACAAGKCGTVTNPPVDLGPECTESDVRKLAKNCKRSNLSATEGNYSYHYIDIPSGTTELKITMTGGNGEADLYYNAGSWAMTGDYTSRATGDGNEHTLTVQNPSAGRHFISLYSVKGFDGATVATRF